MNQLKAGAILSYLSITLSLIIGILYTPFMLRMLGQAEYGLYSLAASVIAYLTILDLGFGTAIVRYTAKFRAQNKLTEQYEMFGMFFRLYIAIGLIALAIGLALLFNVDNIFDRSMNATELDQMRVMMLLMSINLAFTFPLSIFGSILTAYENFVFIRVVNIVRMILNPLVMIVLLFMGYKAITMVVVTTIFNLLTLLVNWWYCKKKLRIKIIFGKFNMSLLKEISMFSFWVLLNTVMDLIYWSTGQFILGIYQGVAVVAVYAVAIQLKTLFFSFSTAISSVFLPKITAMITNKASDAEISDLFIRTGRIQYVIMGFILSAFVVCGESFVNIWAGENYQQAYTYTLLFMFPSLIPLIQNLGISILQARNELKFRSVVYFVISTISVFASIYLAQIYGGLGCAISTAAALFIGQGLVMNVYYQKKIRINITKFWKEIARMSIVPVCLIAFGLIIGRYVEITSISEFLILASIYTLIYFPLCYLFTMNDYERGMAREILVAIKTKIAR